VLPDGSILTDEYSIAACGSLGVAEGRAAFMALPARLRGLRFVGIGVTEAGIVHNGPAILVLAEFLHACYAAGLAADARLSVINTDNVPFNGDSIASHVASCDYVARLDDGEAFCAWVRARVVFHNTMVDRITSHRAGAPEVPRAEPLPKKALVLEDLVGVLPPALVAVPGVVVRKGAGQLADDVALKLRLANGTPPSLAPSPSPPPRPLALAPSRPRSRPPPRHPVSPSRLE
jgi:hypothetical protein